MLLHLHNWGWDVVWMYSCWCACAVLRVMIFSFDRYSWQTLFRELCLTPGYVAARKKVLDSPLECRGRKRAHLACLIRVCICECIGGRYVHQLVHSCGPDFELQVAPFEILSRFDTEAIKEHEVPALTSCMYTLLNLYDICENILWHKQVEEDDNGEYLLDFFAQFGDQLPVDSELKEHWCV